MATDDTGWRKPDLVQTPTGNAKGIVTPTTGLEEKPCFTCRSWEKDTQKLTQFLRSKGLQPDADGKYETPIVRDFNGRRSLKIDPRDFGYCRRQCMPTHMQASCADWNAVRTRSELQGKIT
jgi:hypothetical protein